MVIHQGDAYSIPFVITSDNGVVITNENCADVRIKIGHKLKSYSGSQITYDEDETAWLYPLTEKETIVMYDKVPYEVSVKFSTGDIFKTCSGYIDVSNTIIDEGWSNG